MSATEARTAAPFGTILGHAPGGVPAYSSDYATADDSKLPNRSAYRSYLHGVYMGYKWQCVEFARRWMYVNRGYVFDDVAMAYDIFRLRSVRSIRGQRILPLHSFRNGARRPPEPGCMLIWKEGGEFTHTGHVAIVTDVFDDRIRFAEQNFDHHPWPAGRDWSRELRATVGANGDYWIECSYGDVEILGWVIQTDDPTHAEKPPRIDARLLDLQLDSVANEGQAEQGWLNLANPDEAAYVAMMGGHHLTSRPDDQYRFFVMSDSAEEELQRATNELHALFLHATDYVLRDDSLLERFNIPRAIWPKIHQSWDNRRNQMITGRFDFTLSAAGLKVYEYNSDSASCHMECGKVQGKWAEHFDCDIGHDAGEELHELLVEAWKKSDVDSVLHIMQDTDLEETYHALFMREALEEAGIETKVLHGVEGLRWADDGSIVDADGVPIRWVWKTWAWETALDQIRAECEDDEEKLRTYQPGRRRNAPPRLVDVLLRREVMVYEPLWTLIPSNKAILPILWQLFPNHPYLLDTAYELTDELRRAGYVSKPIAGRCGSNIRIFENGEELDATDGRFDHQDQIYQQLFRLPKLGGHNVQVCTFTAGGTYAGACVRTDPSLVITTGSDLMALRAVSDREMTGLYLQPAPARA